MIRGGVASDSGAIVRDRKETLTHFEVFYAGSSNVFRVMLDLAWADVSIPVHGRNHKSCVKAGYRFTIYMRSDTFFCSLLEATSDVISD